jgi:hypothetical protein
MALHQMIVDHLIFRLASQSISFLGAGSGDIGSDAR